MKRNYQKSTCCAINDQDLIRQTAFHEAGHAAGIYLYNKHKQLPPVYFQITINPVHRPIEKTWDTLALSGDHFTAMVEGGRLISSLPIAIIESTEFFSDHWRWRWGRWNVKRRNSSWRSWGFWMCFNTNSSG